MLSECVLCILLWPLIIPLPYESDVINAARLCVYFFTIKTKCITWCFLMYVFWGNYNTFTTEVSSSTVMTLTPDKCPQKWPPGGSIYILGCLNITVDLHLPFLKFRDKLHFFSSMNAFFKPPWLLLHHVLTRLGVYTYLNRSQKTKQCFLLNQGAGVSLSVGSQKAVWFGCCEMLWCLYVYL